MANIPEIDPNDRLVDYENAPRGGRPRWRRRILTGLVAVAAIGGFAMVVVWSLDQGPEKGGQTVAPVVKAMDGPTRVKPAEPGGMQIPDQDKQVFTRLDPNAAKTTVERLLPPPERVLDSPPAPARPAVEMELTPAPAPVPKPPAVAAAPPPAPPVAERAVERAAEKVVERTAGQAGEKVAETAAEKAAAQEAAKQAASAAAAAASVAPAAGGFRVQLVALRSEQAARTAWAGYVKQHADLFGKLKPTVVKAEIKGKGTFYRLQAGPLADDAAARGLCDKVRKRKIGCLVVAP